MDCLDHSVHPVVLAFYNIGEIFQIVVLEFIIILFRSVACCTIISCKSESII